MGLNIKNAEVELLAREVAEMAGETKTEAVRQSLTERKERLARKGTLTKGERMQKFLEEEVWPKIPDDVRGKELTKAEREEILGYGPDGY